MEPIFSDYEEEEKFRLVLKFHAEMNAFLTSHHVSNPVNLSEVHKWELVAAAEGFIARAYPHHIYLHRQLALAWLKNWENEKINEAEKNPLRVGRLHRPAKSPGVLARRAASRTSES